MKRTVKGFTLIECIIAMAIMGIASLLMVQVYGTVALMNRDNQKMNASLEVQMEYAEQQLADGGGDVKVGRYSNYTPDTSDSTENGGTKSGTLTDGIDFTLTGGNITKFDKTKKTSEIDLYVIGTDNGSSEDETYDSNTVRYKFILPRQYDENKGQGG